MALLGIFNRVKMVLGPYKYQVIRTEELVRNDDEDTPRSDAEGEIDPSVTFEDLPLEVLISIEKSLKWRLDIRLLACVWVMFILNFLDRVHTLAVQLVKLR